jgi:ABC-type uncharacterized transport system permease subunit
LPLPWKVREAQPPVALSRKGSRTWQAKKSRTLSQIRGQLVSLLLLPEKYLYFETSAKMMRVLKRTRQIHFRSSLHAGESKEFQRLER